MNKLLDAIPCLEIDNKEDQNEHGGAMMESLKKESEEGYEADTSRGSISDPTSASAVKRLRGLRRSNKSKIIKYYHKLKLQTVVDPLALVAVLISLFPIIQSTINFFTPQSIDFFPSIVRATFNEEKRTLSNGTVQDIIALSIPFEIRNYHPTKNAFIEGIEVEVQMDGKVFSYYSRSKVYTTISATEPDKLIVNDIGNASSFTVRSDAIVSDEFLFEPKAGSVTDPLKNALRKTDFVSFMKAGGILQITVRIKANEITKDFAFVPKQSVKAGEYVDRRGWTTSEMEKSHLTIASK